MISEHTSLSNYCFVSRFCSKEKSFFFSTFVAFSSAFRLRFSQSHSTLAVRFCIFHRISHAFVIFPTHCYLIIVSPAPVLVLRVQWYSMIVVILKHLAIDFVSCFDLIPTLLLQLSSKHAASRIHRYKLVSNGSAVHLRRGYTKPVAQKIQLIRRYVV